MAGASLSARVNLEQSRKQAKDLVKAFRASDPQALDRIRWNHPRFRGLGDHEIRQREFSLADAQLVIARLHYFDNWPKLVRHIDTLQRGDERVVRFEQAADAIIAGDIPKLRVLLRRAPSLVTERSSRAHRSALLHYIAANGVEKYRQISPKNAVDVTRILLDAGAQVDAVSEAYGGGSTALGLVATSTPPRLAGVQIALIDLLLERGAAIDGVKPGASSVLAALANDCPEAAVALAQRGAKVETVIAAAGVGRLELVRDLAASATQKQLEDALVMGARYGRADVVRFLLDIGVDVNAADGMPALHWATGRGDLGMLQLLIQRGADLEKRNDFGGTALASTIWFAFHVDPSEFERNNYPVVINALITAGARTDVYAEMHADIDEVYRRSGQQRPHA